MIACAMIVGPGEGDRYLEPVLDRASEWADKLVVVADHVDLKTEELLAHERRLGADEVDGNKVAIAFLQGEQPTFLQDESYVRNRLLGLCDEELEDGDLVVVLDADEMLEMGNENVNPRTALGHLAGLPAQSFTFVFYHLWAPDGSVYRTDMAWTPGAQVRAYKHHAGERLAPRRLACGAVPASALPRFDTRLRVAHWGYARPSDRVAKYERYMEIDNGRYHSSTHLDSILGPGMVAPFPPA